MPLWNPVRTKVHLRMAIQRLQTLKEKKEALAKVARRDIATLIERKKLETARIKVETIIHDDTYIELLEVLELYSEILLARFGLLENGSGFREPDPSISEVIIGIVHSAHRTEIKELHFVRESLMTRFGRDWSVNVMENKDSCVSTRITGKLKTETPPSSLVDAYLGTIAEGYGLPWTFTVPPNAAPGAEALSDLNHDQPPEIVLGAVARNDQSSSDKGDPSVKPARHILPKASTTAGPESNKSTTFPSPPKQPPPYSSSVKSNGRGDDDGDDNDDLLRRFEALKTRH
ncbi:regulator of Vps4 activity in the MVB pathway-domain-containing protein [Cantharellus anzutake]|uniref:regulator of Vps4 activity in the MVB pathway-domain-containing protein n=1 Tax=Cantharellus anzutake TaxID=1750568 RepID=UPI0019081C60|nr:regulator of Vps4 activity in the MVB pathway-domain-containing protein [Cantharellus anzutake]XP_038919337.1 regulator of Vps4 activity in the MVB pathway-domain-containing protein [Cantharellus anzutake]KAF8311800.1 regulator of Vps4 activity in the MVB pathway-domain-containing protein [Cantharellus anzutake]KAF8336524.1 regulator of Vps4 activity in the MVB pathway-domain-containing protein [Cantharellus anzutake]